MIAAVVERCAGIDVGKRFLKVCVMAGPLSGEPASRFAKWIAPARLWRIYGIG